MIEILKIGEDALHLTDFEVNRPNGFPEYLLLLIKTPSRFLIDENWVVYPPNCAVLFAPYQMQRYTIAEEAYVDCWMHFTCDHIKISEHFPYGSPILMRQPDELYQLFHLICSNWYGVAPHRSRVLDRLTDSLLYMIEDANNTAHYPDIYYELTALREQIYHSPANPWTIAEMAKQLKISTGYLHNVYQQYFHTTCMNDVIQSRIEMACELLSSSRKLVSEIAEQCGYNNTEHFIRQFKAHTNITPGQFRKTHNHLDSLK